MDQNTRRLDAGETGCPKCGTIQIWAEATAYGYTLLLQRTVGTGFLGVPKKNSTECRALTCPACGYTEFYTSEPEQMGDQLEPT